MTERKRFESWARQRWTHPEDFDARIKDPGKYNNYEVQAAWEAWQERAAQPAQNAVAYLDLGVGGYMDIGTDLTDEGLATLPKGRHMLGVIGTYGVDGYVPAQPAPSAPDGVAEAQQRLIENGAVLGPASSEDALLVARYRQRLLACAPSVPDGWIQRGMAELEAIRNRHDDDTPLNDRALIERIGKAMLAAAPEAKPCGAQSVPSVSVAALRPVIDWLRNGCDPQEAAKELEILIAAAAEAKP